MAAQGPSSALQGAQGFLECLLVLGGATGSRSLLEMLAEVLVEEDSGAYFGYLASEGRGSRR